MLQKRIIYRHIKETHPIGHEVNHELRDCYKWRLRVICNPIKHGGGNYEIVVFLHMFALIKFYLLTQSLIFLQTL